jgi:hypothetical protein
MDWVTGLRCQSFDAVNIFVGTEALGEWNKAGCYGRFLEAKSSNPFSI